MSSGRTFPKWMEDPKAPREVTENPSRWHHSWELIKAYRIAVAILFGVLIFVLFVCIVVTVLITIALGTGIFITVSPDDDDSYSHRLTASIILGDTPLFDAHNDLPWALRSLYNSTFTTFNLSHTISQLNTDIPKIHRGRLASQFWSVYVPCSFQGPPAVEALLEQCDVVQRLTQWYPGAFVPAFRSADIDTAFDAHRVASFYGAEGGHAIDCRLDVLRQIYATGVRYMTLTHSCSTPWCESSNKNPPVPGGLTAFGRNVVREMNRLGMLVDISHVSDEAMNAVLDTTSAPVIFSHSSARAICNVARNVPDTVLQRLPGNGGVVCVNFYALFVSDPAIAEYNRLSSGNGTSAQINQAMIQWLQTNDTAPNIDTILTHIEHIIDVAGEDHVCIGSDFDGVSSLLPKGLEDVSKYPDLVQRMIDRGYSEKRIKKIISKNLQRVFREAEEVSEQLRATLPLDGSC